MFARIGRVVHNCLQLIFSLKSNMDERYSAEYAVTGRSTCKKCRKCINEGELRLVIIEEAKNFDGNTKGNYHGRCFVSVKRYNPVDHIENIDLMSNSDQTLLRSVMNEVPSTSSTSDADEAFIREIERQNDLFYSMKDSLREVPKETIKEILVQNGQYSINTRYLEQRLVVLADLMVFGVPILCPTCQNQLLFDSYSYKCSGKNEWSNCQYSTQNPERYLINIPKIFLEMSPFDTYTPTFGTRLFKSRPKQEDLPSSRERRDLNGDDQNLKITELITVEGTFNVAPDSGLSYIAEVYKDFDGNAYTVKMVKSDYDQRKNSFYILQLLKSKNINPDVYWVFRSYGKIGTDRKDQTTNKYKDKEEAIEEFEKIFLDKTGNDWILRHKFQKRAGKYHIMKDITMHEQLYLSIDENSKLPLAVQEVVKLIFDKEHMNNVLLEYEINPDLMPLGYICKDQINKATEVLEELLNNMNDKDKIVRATNTFYTLIPHKGPLPLLNNNEIISEKFDMLDNLRDIEITYDILSDEFNDASPIDCYYQKLNTVITPLDPNTEVYKYLEKYVRNGQASPYFSVEIQQIFSVVREGEDERFAPFKNLHNRRLLWHGSRITNYTGLRVAPLNVPTTGYMFGKGIYFADTVTKSGQYCRAINTNFTGLMLLCEVALGDMLECHEATFITKLPSDKQSVWGVGQRQPDPDQNYILQDGTIVPLGETKQYDNIVSELIFNEFIVYDAAQVNVKYLFLMKFSYNI